MINVLTDNNMLSKKNVLTIVYVSFIYNIHVLFTIMLGEKNIPSSSLTWLELVY